jgi:hypothetical protein
MFRAEAVHLAACFLTVICNWSSMHCISLVVFLRDQESLFVKPKKIYCYSCWNLKKLRSHCCIPNFTVAEIWLVPSIWAHKFGLLIDSKSTIYNSENSINWPSESIIMMVCHNWFGATATWLLNCSSETAYMLFQSLLLNCIESLPYTFVLAIHHTSIHNTQNAGKRWARDDHKSARSILSSSSNIGKSWISSTIWTLWNARASQNPYIN